MYGPRTLLLTALITVLIAPSLFAWHTNTHLQMTRDAISLMPLEFREMFLNHPKYYEAGIKDPDEVLRDWQNHYYLPMVPEGTALDRIDKITKIIDVKFKNSSSVDVSKQLCYLAHYVGDLWTPESMIKKSTADDMVFVKDQKIYVYFEGYEKPIENIRDYLHQRSLYRWSIENSKEVSTLLYSEAVNDIARIWLTLWQRSGKEVAPLNAALIAHNKEALNVNFQQLLKQEMYDSQKYDNEAKWYDKSEARRREVERLKSNINVDGNELLARSELRNQTLKISEVSPQAPFSFLEFSLKPVGEKSFFVARLRNRGEASIGSISFMYPGIRGPIATVAGLEPGEIVKIEGFLPADASKDKIQLIFGSMQ